MEYVTENVRRSVDDRLSLFQKIVLLEGYSI